MKRFYSIAVLLGIIIAGDNTAGAQTPSLQLSGSVNAQDQPVLSWTLTNFSGRTIHYILKRCGGAGCKLFGPLEAPFDSRLSGGFNIRNQPNLPNPFVDTAESISGGVWGYQLSANNGSMFILSNPVYINILANVPSIVIQQPDDNDITHNSVLIHWEFENNPNPFVFFSRLLNICTGADECLPRLTDGPNWDTSPSRLSGLRPASTYTFQLDDIPTGTQSNVITFQTLPAVIGIPGPIGEAPTSRASEASNENKTLLSHDARRKTTSVLGGIYARIQQRQRQDGRWK